MNMIDTLNNTKFEIREEIKNAEISKELKKSLLYHLQRANFQRFYAKFVQNYDHNGMQDLIIDYLVSNAVKTVKTVDKEDIDYYVRDMVFNVIPSTD